MKNKADSKKGIKVHSVSVLYSRKESEAKNSSCQFMVWCGTPDWHLAWSYQGLSGWQWGTGDYSTEQLSREKMSICNSQSERKFVCMPMGGKSERCGSRGWHMKGAALNIQTLNHSLAFYRSKILQTQTLHCTLDQTPKLHYVEMV